MTTITEKLLDPEFFLELCRLKREEEKPNPKKSRSASAYIDQEISRIERTTPRKS